MTTWIIPNNPKDYDIYNGLAEYGQEIEWTKSLPTTNIAVGDTVYLYIAAPIKALKMKFTVVDSNVTSPRQRHRNNGLEADSNCFMLKFHEHIKPIAYETLFNRGVVNGYIQAARILKPMQVAELHDLLRQEG